MATYFNIRYANGYWQGWAALPGIAGAKYFSDQSASITGMPDGSSQVFARQLGNFVTTYENTRYINGGWSGWTLVPSPAQLVAAAGFGSVS